MTSQKALWLPKVGAELVLGTNDIPEPGPGEVLFKLEASALNPLDVQIQQSGFFEITKYPIVIGEEGAGVVQKVGKGASNLAKGDKIQPVLQIRTDAPRKPNLFVPRILCSSCRELVSKVGHIPPNISFDQAASISVAFVPFAMATYAQEPDGIGLTPPFEDDGLGKYAGQPIVIFDGASSVGQQAIQLSKLSGFSPIVTTASLYNQDLLLSLGAMHVLDRHLPSDALIARVRQLVTHPLMYIFDAVSVRETQLPSYALLESGGTLVVVRPPQIGGDNNGSGKRVLFINWSSHRMRTRALGAKFATALTRWVEEGEIKPNRVEVLPGGLNGVVDGLTRLKAGISATKLVIRPPETTDSSG